MEKKTRKKSNIVKGQYAVYVGIVVIIILVVLFITLFVIPKDVKVPNVQGLSLEDAKQMLEDNKLNYEILEEYSNKIEKGHIISQEYTGTVKENTKVRLIVSTNQQKVNVPKIFGMKESEGIKELEKNKLKVEVIRETSEKVEKGYIIKQEPKDNESVDENTTVKIYVSNGTEIEKTVVPYVIGKTQEQATTELTNAKLKVEVVNEEDDTKDKGIVLKQSINVGEVVDEKTIIVITVNK